MLELLEESSFEGPIFVEIVELDCVLFVGGVRALVEGLGRTRVLQRKILSVMVMGGRSISMWLLVL
ncbi:hypothetical protein HanXRQr2_Chr17g0781281 [Helianthus annuus]|uniref:Uncharacterized protein n=1 Tax=Helianthus annuus TaxID=4232 RepID=A0A9K3DEV4_HELAN|nr:hypothetical protein HanXRQr2_Chr17g0781281 [Helianthus annuus]